MPDLRSELEKVIHAWEQPEQPESQPTHETIMTTPTAPTLSANERLFNFVKANPGLTAMQIESRVPDVAPTSLSSLLAAMAKRHLLVKSGGSGPNHYGGVFHAAVDKYMSPAEQLGVGRSKRMSSHKVKPKKVKKQSKQMDMFTLDTSVRKAPPAPAPQPELTVSSPAPQMRSVFDLDIESLTIAEARALRDKLNALFGG